MSGGFSSSGFARGFSVDTRSLRGGNVCMTLADATVAMTMAASTVSMTVGTGSIEMTMTAEEC